MKIYIKPEIRIHNVLVNNILQSSLSKSEREVSTGLAKDNSYDIGENNESYEDE